MWCSISSLQVHEQTPYPLIPTVDSSLNRIEIKKQLISAKFRLNEALGADAFACLGSAVCL